MTTQTHAAVRTIVEADGGCTFTVIEIRRSIAVEFV